jgi:hypothetical protein
MGQPALENWKDYIIKGSEVGEGNFSFKYLKKDDPEAIELLKREYKESVV